MLIIEGHQNKKLQKKENILKLNFCKPTPIYSPIHQPIIPPKTDANVVRKVIKKIFFGFEITHAASKGSIGIGKNIDSAKDKP